MSSGSTGKRRRTTSPADRVRQWDRRHGVTPELRQKVGGHVVLMLVALFVLGILLLGLLVGVVGMQAFPEDQGGRGQVSITACERHQVFRQRCRGSVTTWDGTEYSPGDRVEVISRSTLRGRTDVVARVRGGTETDPQGRTVHVAEPVLVPEGDWIMPNGWRLATFMGFGLVWVGLMWWLSRVVFLRLLQRARRREGT